MSKQVPKKVNNFHGVAKKNNLHLEIEDNDYDDEGVFIK